MNFINFKDARELEAKKYNLNYIGFDGNIGCLGTFSCDITLYWGFLNAVILMPRLKKNICKLQINKNIYLLF